MNTDISYELAEQVESAYALGTALKIVGGNSKVFYGADVTGESLAVSGHQGILNYEPTELVITARAGTPLSEIEKILNENGQMLGFEPPAYGSAATLGGTIAGNFSGPRRAYAGAARDFVLGCKIINGKGEILSFGGEVMKNVAGYDVSRLMAGALGTLGILLEVSLKVLPKPEVEVTHSFACKANEALEKMHAWGQKPLPVSATYYHDSRLHLRLSGAEKAILAAKNAVGGDELVDAGQFWLDVKEHASSFFQTAKPLWRLSIASDTAPLDIPGECAYEWGGALRWLFSEASSDVVFSIAAEYDGHATLFRNPQHDLRCFQPLAPGLLSIHKNLKKAFDPKGILNAGKLYAEI